MHATTKSNPAASPAVTLAVDLAKDVFELVFADGSGRIVERKRLKRGPFASCLDNHSELRVVMEACGSAHYWAQQSRSGFGQQDSATTMGRRTPRRGLRSRSPQSAVPPDVPHTRFIETGSPALLLLHVNLMQACRSPNRTSR